MKQKSNISQQTSAVKPLAVPEIPITTRFISLLTDYGFKGLLGNEQNKQLTIYFLNAVLHGKRVVYDITFSDKEVLDPSSDHRTAIVDILCNADQEDQFIIELQLVKLNFSVERTVYHVCSQIVNRAPIALIENGKPWDYIQEPTFLISLLDIDQPDSDPDQYCQYIRLRDELQNQFLFDKLTFIILELPKFAKQLVNEEKINRSSPLEKWLYTIKNMDKLDKVPQFMLEGPFKKIVEFAEVKNMNQEQRAEYVGSLRDLRDEQALRDGVFDTGWTEGEKNDSKFEGEILDKEIQKEGELTKEEQEIRENKRTATIKNLLRLGYATLHIANNFNIDASLVLEIKKSMVADGK